MLTLPPKHIAGLRAAFDFLATCMDDYADDPERTPRTLGLAYWGIVDLLQAAGDDPKTRTFPTLHHSSVDLESR